MMQTNLQLEQARELIHTTDVHLFLTGKAGTGKTTFLRQLRKESSKKMVVLAPTGVAAIQAQGVTIHSFFQLPFTPFLPGYSMESLQSSQYKMSKEKLRIIRAIELLVIDEISMVRADLLDAVDAALKRFRRSDQPFGGVQLLMIGDLQQLSPVVTTNEEKLLKDFYSTPYFFSSKALTETDFCTIELRQIFRQSDTVFIDLLNQVRENRLSAAGLELLNSHCLPDFEPAEDQGYITLTTHNAQSQRINLTELEKIRKEPFTFEAKVEGTFPEYSYPTDLFLTLKKGAQVMFLKNDTNFPKRYFNGKIGKILSISSNAIEVLCKDDSEPIQVEKSQWSNVRYGVDPQSQEIIEVIEGSFTQFPLKAAWAITIHKSQGLTFERMILEGDRAFAHGQIYVALSRCRSLEGLVLKVPLSTRTIKVDNEVVLFHHNNVQHDISASLLEEWQHRYFQRLVRECFDFDHFAKTWYRLINLLLQHYKMYSNLLQKYKEAQEVFYYKIQEVAEKFRMQLAHLYEQGEGVESSALLQERIYKAKIYFYPLWKESIAVLLAEPLPEVDNKDARKKGKEWQRDLSESLDLILETLDAINPMFTVANYLAARSKSQLCESNMAEVPKRERKRKESKEEAKVLTMDDVKYQELFDSLIAWRKYEASDRGLPAYCILSQSSIIHLANDPPKDGKELLKVKGIGKKVVENYGADIMRIIDENVERTILS